LISCVNGEEAWANRKRSSGTELNTGVQNSKLQIIRKSSFTAMPWKNGGGITHEAIPVPASSDPFRWRVSVAHVDASGPF